MKDGKNTPIDLNLSVPTEKLAQHMSNNWKNVSDDIYAYIIQKLQ